ncbi:MAG: hypothetical protein JL50_02275 [Peptococcaceae bacterium BICA1-7]|nr:MAG: hypothetical protein JL50_02275 [Peptococcaceae bacterium BICA1-7]HBV95454.1 hypothetical protein [Desulfotomaculum sp.]
MVPVLCNLLFCNKVAAESGRYNLEGIFYRIHALGYPCRHRCFVVAGWCGDSGSHSFTLKFLTPDRGRVVFETPLHLFSLSVATPYFNSVVEVLLTFEQEGAHWFEIILNGHSGGFFPIHVETLPHGALQRPV